jgi:hypothetical protein
MSRRPGSRRVTSRLWLYAAAIAAETWRTVLVANEYTGIHRQEDPVHADSAFPSPARR